MDAVEGGLHAARRNLERLDEERTDAKREAEGDDENFSLIRNFGAFFGGREAWNVVRILFQRFGNQLVVIGFPCVADIVQNIRKTLDITWFQNVAVAKKIIVEELLNLRELIFALSLRRAAILLDIVSEEEPEDGEIDNDLDVQWHDELKLKA